MVRIPVYDPRVPASVLSQPAAVTRPFDSPVADGLGRLGRAVDQRLQRLREGKNQIVAMDAVEAFRRDERGRLDKIRGAGSEVGEGFQDAFMADHAVRRDKTIARLETERPGRRRCSRNRRRHSPTGCRSAPR